jgi:hypothetical protein
MFLLILFVIILLSFSLKLNVNKKNLDNLLKSSHHYYAEVKTKNQLNVNVPEGFDSPVTYTNFFDHLLLHVRHH